MRMRTLTHARVLARVTLLRSDAPAEHRRAPGGAGLSLRLVGHDARFRPRLSETGGKETSAEAQPAGFDALDHGPADLVEQAARRTVRGLTRGRPGVYCSVQSYLASVRIGAHA
jgi:hypothetical protein